MKKVLTLIQFIPLSVFLGVARSFNYTHEAWAIAFQLGAVVGLLEMIILLPLLGNGVSRLIAGTNVFLIAGGIAFFFNISILLNLIGTLREAGLFISLALASLLGIFITPTGVFERRFSKCQAEKNYSVIFLIGIAAALSVSIFYRGNPMMAGAVPFVFILLLKQYLQRKLATI